MPHVIIIAGPNGAGKTTAAPALLQQALHVDHFVNADRRRYRAGLKNFFNLYKPIAWKMYDNTDINNFALIASKINTTIVVNNRPIWNKLVEAYDETGK